MCATKNKKMEIFWKKYAVEWFSSENNNLYTASASLNNKWTLCIKTETHLKSIERWVDRTAAQMNLHIFEIIQVVTVNDLHCILHVKINVWFAFWTQNPLIAFPRIAIHNPARKLRTNIPSIYTHSFTQPYSDSCLPHIFRFYLFSLFVYSVSTFRLLFNLR